MRIAEMCHGHEMKNSQNKEISFEKELFFSFPKPSASKTHLNLTIQAFSLSEDD